MSRFTKRTTAVLAAGIFVVTGGVAYAYWTASGSGDGSAATGTNGGITVVQTSMPTALYPGGPGGALSGTFMNTNSQPVYVAQVTAAVLNVDGTAWSVQANAAKPACTAADFTIVQPTATDAEVRTDDTSTWSGGTITLDDRATNQDNCKSVSPPIHYITS